MYKIYTVQKIYTWSYFIAPTAKYEEEGCAKYRPQTEAGGSIARDSVRVMPVRFSVSISRHMVIFSVWSGWLGYPGAGRMPYKNNMRMQDNQWMQLKQLKNS